MNLAHASYVCKHGAAWNRKGHCPAIPWLRSLVARYTPISLIEWIKINDWCSWEIIRRETGGTFDHTIPNSQGSGAYGWPQALPGWKMISAGLDWRTNPATQYRWMKGYMNGRYGSSCGALAFHNANGWY
jgi:hypothetical protein